MSVNNVPEPSKAASGWLELLKKANDYNLIPLLLAAAVGYAYWTDKADAKKSLEASEARTRAALIACTDKVTGESSKTREEVRKKVTELRGVLEQPAPATPP